jgi:hypothetical protein
MQQMMKQLLAKANQALLTRMESDQEQTQARMKAKIDTNMERMDANLKDLKEDIKSSQAEMRSTSCATRSELEGAIQQKMKGVLSYVEQKMQNLRMELTETTKETNMEL